MLWVLERDMFLLENLQKHTRYDDFLHQMGGDEVYLDEIAEELTTICLIKHQVTWQSMIMSLGNVAVQRKLEVERVLNERIGKRADWKVVCTGVDYSRANCVSRFFACLLTPLPSLWIRIAL